MLVGEPVVFARFVWFSGCDESLASGDQIDRASGYLHVLLLICRGMVLIITISVGLYD